MSTINQLGLDVSTHKRESVDLQVVDTAVLVTDTGAELIPPTRSHTHTYSSVRVGSM